MAATLASRYAKTTGGNRGVQRTAKPLRVRRALRSEAARGLRWPKLQTYWYTDIGFGKTAKKLVSD